jgi:putative SOS response-associated peptidase YedK
MCGRVVLSSAVDVLADYFDAATASDVADSFEPGFNLAPTRQLLGLIATPNEERLLETFRWGLVPSWAPDLSTGNRMFNARSESISRLPAFRASFTSRRTAVVVDGFFEWRKDGGKHRQPFYFRRADGAPMLFAGLWAVWRDPPGPWLRSCSIITTAANIDMAGIHDRMPVVLEEPTLDLWLDPEQRDVEWLGSLLQPAAPGVLSKHPVGLAVGDVRNDDASLVEPAEEVGRLF